MNPNPSGATSSSTANIRIVDTETEVAACYELMHQLRPHLSSEQEFVERWQRQAPAGYRLVAIWRDSRPVALAGFRILNNLVHGKHLYVDDLVAEEGSRRRGFGRTLMQWLQSEGRSHGCAKLVLDAALSNTLGHRFYYRQGLLATALRFTMPLA